jgi:hypothetical protein
MGTTESEVSSYRDFSRVEDRQEAAEMARAGTKQGFGEPSDPWPREDVNLRGPPVLECFPRYESTEDGFVVRVRYETELARFASQLSRFTLYIPAELRRLGAELFTIGVEPARYVDDRGRSDARAVSLERALAVHKVVKLPDGESARPQELACIPLRAGSVNDALAVGQPRRDRRARPPPASFEREEPDG